tara:strand:+ start:1122 stop:2066 length:945 start_codon:yes stop_codon:yes gene_type:complete
MKVLVTGASGYIGSQTCKLLKQEGHTVIASDRRAVKHNYFDGLQNFGDYGNISPKVVGTDTDAVVHIAATSLVGPSVTDPATYYQNNIAQTLNLLDVMRETNIKNIIFASSAACYGEPENGVCSIEDGNIPMNPYGWTKRMMEVILNDYAKAYGINSVSLRFFNVAGADSEGEFGQEKQATHIIARAIESAIAGKKFTLFGNDYPTPDGSCVRDYVHVEDIANGIVTSLAYASCGCQPGAHVFNLGNDSGYSNLEIIRAIEKNTPLKVDYDIGPRRDGDPASLVADVSETRYLGWEPKHNLDSIITTAYNWYTR